MREYRLTQTFRYRLLDRKGEELTPPTELGASREMTYNDGVLGSVLAKNRKKHCSTGISNATSPASCYAGSETVKAD